MNLWTRFWNWIGRMGHAKMDQLEDAEPIENLRNEELRNRDAELHDLLDSHTDAGRSLGRLRNMLKTANDAQIGLEQNSADAAEEAVNETDEAKKTIAMNKAARAAQRVADNLEWINEIKGYIQVAVGDMAANELNLDDYDGQTEEIDARYQVAAGRWDALQIKKALTASLERSTLARRPVNSHIKSVEERVAAEEGAVEARGSAVSSILRNRGQRIASKKVVVTGEADRILQEALAKAKSKTGHADPATQTQETSK